MSCQQENNILVATSANMQFVMKELVNTYTKKTNHKIDLVVGSSGKLSTQIEHGAPYDIFVSANKIYPEYLYKKGLGKTPPKTYAKGQLILWSTKDFPLSLKMLKTKIIKKIAIANPKTAPYGKATIEFLKKSGIYKDIKNKLVFGESISQVNQFITTQSVEVGFTTQAIKHTKQYKSGNFLELANSPLLSQSALLINHKDLNKNAIEFYNFLFTNEAKKIFNQFGYATKNQL